MDPACNLKGELTVEGKMQKSVYKKRDQFARAFLFVELHFERYRT
jgi:hypothetical protein